MTIPGLHDVFCIKIVFQWLIYCRVVNINSVYSYLKSHFSLVTLYIEFIQNNYGLLLNLDIFTVFRSTLPTYDSLNRGTLTYLTFLGTIQ